MQLRAFQKSIKIFQKCVFKSIIAMPLKPYVKIFKKNHRNRILNIRISTEASTKLFHTFLKAYGDNAVMPFC